MKKLCRKASLKTLSRKSSQRTLYSSNTSQKDLTLESVEEAPGPEPKGLIRRLCGVFSGSCTNLGLDGAARPRLKLVTDITEEPDSDGDTLVSAPADCGTNPRNSLKSPSRKPTECKSSVEPLPTNNSFLHPPHPAPCKPRRILSESQLALLLQQQDSEDPTSSSNSNRRSTFSSTPPTRTNSRDNKYPYARGNHYDHRFDFQTGWDPAPHHSTKDAATATAAGPPHTDGGDGHCYATKLRPPPWHLQRRNPGALTFNIQDGGSC